MPALCGCGPAPHNFIDRTWQDARTDAELDKSVLTPEQIHAVIAKIR